MTFANYFVAQLYRNAETPIHGTASGAVWAWPGNACTSSLLTFYPQLQTNATIQYARWVLVWNPNTGTSPTGVRLVHCVDGPSNITEITEKTRTNANTPYDDTVDITTAMQSVWAYYKSRNSGFHLGHQTAGNGANGCLIYGSWVEIGFA